MTIENFKAEVKRRFTQRFGEDVHALNRGEAVTIAFEIMLELVTPIEEQRSHVEAHKEIEARLGNLDERADVAHEALEALNRVVNPR